jgi:hypothetical protein
VAECVGEGTVVGRPGVEKARVAVGLGATRITLPLAGLTPRAHAARSPFLGQTPLTAMPTPTSPYGPATHLPLSFFASSRR